MNLDDFRFKYTGKPVDFDGYYSYQCMDLVEKYNQEVVGGHPFHCNAKDLAKNPQPDFYEYHANTLIYVAVRGSIAVWNDQMGNGFGHCSIVLGGNLMKFTSFDQNWNNVSSPQVVEHTYKNVAGFLVPRAQGVTSKYNDLVEDLMSLVKKYPKT